MHLKGIQNCLTNQSARSIQLLVAQCFSCVWRDIAVDQMQTRPKAKKDIQGEHYRNWQVHKSPLIQVI
jgi:hypothetical protein